MQAAQVIEARLSRYGTITTDLPAAPASVVVCCAAHCQLRERVRRELRISDFWITRCQSMCSSTAAHGSRSIPEAESITNTNYSRVVTNPRLQSERQRCHENSGPK